jgi:hypothetical protein
MMIKIKEDEMGWLYSANGIKNFKGRDHSEELWIDGKIISERILRNMVGWCGLDASDLG